MYKCNDCWAVFETALRDMDNGEVVDTCPDCGSEDIREFDADEDEYDDDDDDDEDEDDGGFDSDEDDDL